MRTVPRFICARKLMGRWIGVVELPGIEPGSGLPSAIACRHVRIRRLTLIRGRVRSANPHGL